MSRLRNRLAALEAAVEGPGQYFTIPLQAGEEQPTGEALAARMPNGKAPRPRDLVVFVRRFAEDQGAKPHLWGEG